MLGAIRYVLSKQYRAESHIGFRNELNDIVRNPFRRLVIPLICTVVIFGALILAATLVSHERIQTADAVVFAMNREHAIFAPVCVAIALASLAVVHFVQNNETRRTSRKLMFGILATVPLFAFLLLQDDVVVDVKSLSTVTSPLLGSEVRMTAKFSDIDRIEVRKSDRKADYYIKFAGAQDEARLNGWHQWYGWDPIVDELRRRGVKVCKTQQSRFQTRTEKLLQERALREC